MPTTIAFAEPVFGRAAELSLAGRLSLRRGVLDTTLDIDRKDPPGGTLELVASFSNATRQLAVDLGLAAGTVARAYRELEQAGYVRSRRGGGTRVAPAPPAVATPERALDDAAAAYLDRARVLGVTGEAAVEAVRRAART